MYEAYWGLSENPFRSDLDERFFFYSKCHEEALVRLLYAVSERAGVTLLLGPPGSGKSFICRMVRKGLENKDFILATVAYPRLPPDLFLCEVAREFNVESPDPSRLGIVNVMGRFFKSSVKGVKKTSVVLIVEDAHAIPEPASFEDLRFLFNLADGVTRFFIVLSGVGALQDRVKANPDLYNRVSLVSVLEPLTEEETGAYLAHRLGVAGSKRPIFLPDAVKEVHARTAGNPRQINLLADTALLAGSGEGVSGVDAALVRKAAEELP